jgi:hypothetical protein
MTSPQLFTLLLLNQDLMSVGSFVHITSHNRRGKMIMRQSGGRTTVISDQVANVVEPSSFLGLEPRVESMIKV